jgi:uncharacterized protein (TIGR03382 family)
MNQMNRCLAAGLLALASASLAAAETVVINVYDFEFSTGPIDQEPIDPVINLGDTVQWVWVNGVHSTTAAMGQIEFWDSDLHEDVGFTFSHTFTNIGVFNYYCMMHGLDLGGGELIGMTGTITVIPSPGAAALLVLGALARRRRRD